MTTNHCNSTQPRDSYSGQETVQLLSLRPVLWLLFAEHATFSLSAWCILIAYLTCKVCQKVRTQRGVKEGLWIWSRDALLTLLHYDRRTYKQVKRMWKCCISLNWMSMCQNLNTNINISINLMKRQTQRNPEETVLTLAGFYNYFGATRTTLNF
jgi:hypothetical protein